MTTPDYDIYKAAGIIIEDRKVISTRSKGSPIFLSPGGKLEPGETEQQALIRELYEELDITVTEGDLDKIADYYAPAAGRPGKTLRMATYRVKSYTGTIKASNEIEEVRAFDTSLPDDIEVASLLRHEILPLLHAQNLVD